MMPSALSILLPVYNDEAALEVILKNIQKEFKDNDHSIKVFVVNDGSANWQLDPKKYSFSIEIIHLVRNLGHQKAIAIGLSYIRAHAPETNVIVMDSDGEDKVSDIHQLLDAHEKASSNIIFAARKKRSNGLKFRFFYYLYKTSFYLLTGKRISFGNFSLLPAAALNKIVYYSEIWNNFPGGIMKSGLNYSSVPLERGNRLSGNSKMNFTSLLLHGLGAIAVFLEIIVTRVAIVSFLLMAFALLTITGIIVIKTTTNLAIPGWASTFSSSMLIILLISFIISLIAIFIYLSMQSQQRIIPAIHYTDYILQVEKKPHAE
jgi:glycosyltransferase involved in cell wall biosynthesis